MARNRSTKARRLRVEAPLCLASLSLFTAVGVSAQTPPADAPVDAAPAPAEQVPSLEPTPAPEVDAAPEPTPAPDAAPAPAPESAPEPPPVPDAAPESTPTPTPEPTTAPTQRRGGSIVDFRGPVAEAASAVRGRVVDASNGEPLIEATVLVDCGQGEVRRVYTDMDGNFEVEVAPGLCTVRTFADFYREARHRPIRVRVGQQVSVTMRLRSAEDEHLVFEVVERADRRNENVLAQERINATTAADSMGQNAMARQGASNAARAASRVVGASLEGNTLVVRGLADRYVTVLMNGVLLPGTDPDRNGVQLDVIPSGIIANIGVVKTFQPELPANWAGGLMAIESVTMPEDFTVRASASMGFNTVVTFRETPDGPGSRLDALGFGLRSRRLPSAVPDYLVRGGTLLDDGTTVDEATATAIGRSFRERWELRPRPEAPAGTLSFSIGDELELGERRRFGYLAGFNYNRTANRRQTIQRLLNSEDNIASEFDSDQVTEEVLLTGFGTLTLRYGEHGDIRVLSMYTQHASDDTRSQLGVENDNGADVERWQFQYVQRAVSFNQLIGEQRHIPWWTQEFARLRYSAYVATSRRDEPSTRQVRYEREQGTTDPLRLTESPNGSDILSFDLDQRDAGGYAHLRFPLFRPDEGEATGDAEIGVDVRFSNRTSYFRQFHWQPVSSADPALLEGAANDVLADANINGIAGPIRFREIGSFPQNNYEGSSAWAGTYLTTDLRATSWLRFAGGVRMEFLRRAVSIVEPIEGTPPLPSSVDPNVSATSVDWLPGFTAIITPKERMNIRLSYGYTVVHPQFREFAPVNYFDFARRRQISGNPDLDRTHIHNADVRWEWLPTTENSLIAASFFYKRFLSPIERVNASAGSRDLVFDNAEGGYNVGGELELRGSFGMFDDASNWLDWFSLNANVALVYSRVTLSDDTRAAQPDPVRPMFFQSPYVANLSLSFDHPDSGVVLTLAYNSVGKRIVEVGAVTSGIVSPNVVEQPFHSLDLIGSYEMNDHWKLNCAVRNILGADRWQTAGDTVVERYNPGTEFGIGVGYTN